MGTLADAVAGAAASAIEAYWELEKWLENKNSTEKSTKSKKNTAKKIEVNTSLKAKPVEPPLQLQKKAAWQAKGKKATATKSFS